MKQPLEDQEQVALVNFLRSRGLFVFHIPNHKKMRQDMGALPGIPDLQIVLKDRAVLWVEMKKRKGGVVSPEQASIHEELEKMGHCVIVARGAKEALELLKQEGIL